MTYEVVQETLAEMEIPGVVARLTKRRYTPGSQISSCLSDHMVVCRITPVKSGIRTSFQHEPPIPNGTMFVIPAKTKAVAIAPPVEEISTTLTLQLRPHWLVDAVQANEDWIARKPDHWFSFYDWHVEIALRRIADAMTRPGPDARLIIGACSLLVAVDLFHRRPSDEGAFDHFGTTIDDHRVRHIRNIIDQSQSPPNIEEIAADLNLTSEYLNRMFKKRTGKTLIAYSKAARLERAMALLNDVSVPLKQIAYDLGYCSASAFCTAFRVSTGMTPRQYRYRTLS